MVAEIFAGRRGLVFRSVNLLSRQTQFSDWLLCPSLGTALALTTPASRRLVQVACENPVRLSFLIHARLEGAFLEMRDSSTTGRRRMNKQAAALALVDGHALSRSSPGMEPLGIEGLLPIPQIHPLPRSSMTSISE